MKTTRRLNETTCKKSWNGTAPCSNQQRYLHDLLGGELNYPIDRCSLDIAFPDKMIYIEYDGSGHNLQVKLGNITVDELNNKEIKRYNYLKSKDWKLIRIISSKDLLPDDEEVISIVNQSFNLLNEFNWIIIDLDKKNIYNNNINIDISNLKLLKITRHNNEKINKKKWIRSNVPR